MKKSENIYVENDFRNYSQDHLLKLSGMVYECKSDLLN